MQVCPVASDQCEDCLIVSIIATVTLNNRKYILNLFDSAGQVMKKPTAMVL